jgi:hypothetical protein
LINPKYSKILKNFISEKALAIDIFGDGKNRKDNETEQYEHYHGRINFHFHGNKPYVENPISIIFKIDYIGKKL